jgi:hypothetical protein
VRSLAPPSPCTEHPSAPAARAQRTRCPRPTPLQSCHGREPAPPRHPPFQDQPSGLRDRQATSPSSLPSASAAPPMTTICPAAAAAACMDLSWTWPAATPAAQRHSPAPVLHTATPDLSPPAAAAGPRAFRASPPALLALGWPGGEGGCLPAGRGGGGPVVRVLASGAAAAGGASHRRRPAPGPGRAGWRPCDAPGARPPPCAWPRGPGSPPGRASRG